MLAVPEDWRAAWAKADAVLCTQGAGGAAEDLMCELLACYSLDAMAGMCKTSSQMPPGDSNPNVQDVLAMVVEDIQTPDNKARVPAVVRALGLRAAQTVYTALPAAIQPRILQVLGLASVPWLPSVLLPPPLQAWTCL